MIRLNIKVKVFDMKTMAGFVFKIDSNNRDTEINLIKILLQFDIVGFKIQSLQIIIIYLVRCLIFLYSKINIF